ncbi:hypothetical protein R3I94_017266 [Phoxinus phoxinus]|uniref:Uncharacterized protein n=1 Tax=Phoxinus phoxinus TaxID=58324 RepID=A0AAN9CGC5_9TELE
MASPAKNKIQPARGDTAHPSELKSC